jgi:outer membrane protein assembly factor BamB
MSNAHRTGRVLVGCVLLLGATCAAAQDWPQWRGPNRDNKVVGFTAPATWPKELMKKWQVPVGLGDASPALVGDKVYVFTRQEGDEVILCLDAGSGKEVWKDKYATAAVSGAAKAHPGPRSSPAVAEGKVCTLGVNGTVSCLDAGAGKVVWRKETTKPQFATASSPIIVEGKCVVYVGALTAFDLASGEEKWKWTGAGTPYGSPVLMTVEGTKQIVTPTDKSIVGVGLTDGKELWKVPFGATAYQNHSSTPIIDGQTVIYSGQPAQKGPTVALKIEKKGDSFGEKELWKNPQQGAGMYNTPVLKDGLLFGLITANRAPSNLFCMDAKTGEVLWKDTTPRGECGEVFDAGSVLLALTSNSELLVFKPSNKGYEELAKYKVSDKGANTGTEGTWAGPIVSGNRVFVKDKDTLTLWTLN